LQDSNYEFRNLPSVEPSALNAAFVDLFALSVKGEKMRIINGIIHRFNTLESDIKDERIDLTMYRREIRIFLMIFFFLN